MSFGQKLGQKARAAHVECRVRWVEENLKRVMEECEEAAGKGESHIRLAVKPPDLAADEALQHLNRKLAELGLASYEAKYVREEEPPWEKMEVYVMARWEMGIATKGTNGSHYKEEHEISGSPFGPKMPPAMSFAHCLEKYVCAAQAEWVEETLQKFMAECEKAAKKGAHTAFLCFDMMKERSSAADAVKLLQHRLPELGLTSCSAGAVHQDRQVRISGRWDAPEVRKKTGIASKGTRGRCPIRHEHRPMVALMLCGHTVCQQCQSSRQPCRCPMCRKNLTGATEALFMG